MKTTFKAATKTEKVSDQIIEQIRDIILSGQVKPGDKIASEKELIVQFGVSKATLREALRVLEAMGLVEIRKGLAGGVFIAEVDMNTTINSMINFLHFKSVSINNITMIRYLLEPPVAQLAASRIRPEDIDKLEALIMENTADPQSLGFHRYLARMTENPILILIMDFVDNLLRDIKIQLNLGSEFYDKVKQSHRRILECLRQKDGAGARREIIRDIIEIGKYMDGIAGSPSFDPAMIFGNDPANQHRNSLIPTNMADSHLPLLQDLQNLIGVESVAKLKNRGFLSRQIGTGKLYLIELDDELESNENERST